MSEAVVLVGIPGTGKSTFVRERLFRTHVRINLDMLRTRHREKRLLEVCLETGQPFVVDNTNPGLEDRRRYVQPARAAGFRVVGYYFRSSVREALERNAARADGERVPDTAVRGIGARLELPSIDEGFDELSYVSLLEGGGFRVEAWRDEVR